jgi:hypothetical protein
MARNKRKKNKKLNYKKVFIAVMILIAIPLFISTSLKFINKKIEYKDYFVASNTNEVTLYTYDEENGVMTDADVIYRGEKVTSSKKEKSSLGWCCCWLIYWSFIMRSNI